MSNHELIRKAKKLCRQACKAMRTKPTAGAIEACRARPGAAVKCYAAVLRSMGIAA